MYMRTIAIDDPGQSVTNGSTSCLDPRHIVLDGGPHPPRRGGWGWGSLQPLPNYFGLLSLLLFPGCSGLLTSMDIFRGFFWILLSLQTSTYITKVLCMSVR